MKKKILFGGIFLLVVASIVTSYILLNNKKEDNKAALAFKEEYEALNGKENANGKIHRVLNISEDNPYVKVTPADIVKMLEEKKTFYLYVGDPLCPWCRSVLEKSIEVAKENEINKIYYIDIWDDEGTEILRDKYELADGKLTKTIDGTKEYYKLLDAFGSVLRDYTLTDSKGKTVEVGEKRIYAPNYFFIKNGKVAKMVSGKSDKQTDSREKLTKEMLADEEEQFSELFLGVCDDAC